MYRVDYSLKSAEVNIRHKNQQIHEVTNEPVMDVVTYYSPRVALANGLFTATSVSVQYTVYQTVR